jgi:hypothetical protein
MMSQTRDDVLTVTTGGLTVYVWALSIMFTRLLRM